MHTEKILCSGAREATVSHCYGPTEAEDLLHELTDRGADSDDVVVVVRNPRFVVTGRRRVPRLVVIAAAAVAGFVAGLLLFEPYLAAVVAGMAALVTTTLTARSSAPSGAVSGQGYDVIARGEAVPLVERLVGGRLPSRRVDASSRASAA